MCCGQIQNGSFATTETVTISSRSSEKCLFDFNHSNFVVKAKFPQKQQSYVNISLFPQQYTKLF